MKEVNITLLPPEIKSINYANSFNKGTNEPVPLSIGIQYAIKLDLSHPCEAAILIKTSIEDDTKDLVLEIETITIVNTSTFINGLDEVLKDNYIPAALIAVNEKNRSIVSNLGINLKLQNPPFAYIT